MPAPSPTSWSSPQANETADRAEPTPTGTSRCRYRRAPSTPMRHLAAPAPAELADRRGESCGTGCAHRERGGVDGGHRADLVGEVALHDARQDDVRDGTAG